MAVEREHSEDVEDDDDDERRAGVNLEQENRLKARSIRQVHTTTRFPQRSGRKEQSVPIMTSTSTEKLVCGIWRQIHSEIRWDMTATVSDERLLHYSPLFMCRVLIICAVSRSEYVYPRSNEQGGELFQDGYLGE